MTRIEQLQKTGIIRAGSPKRVVRSLLKYPGKEVFRYQNGDGEFINVTNRHINEYIKAIMGEKFSAKDFRTWAGTIICACALARVGTEAIEKGAARKRKVVAAIKETSASCAEVRAP